jgi:predicted PhzF superfamily epimerase YddE/YHI9
MSEIHVVRVFLGPTGSGGNPLAVFLDGMSIPVERRVEVAARIGFSETVFLDDLPSGRIAIFTPATELPFAGHPTVGTSWLLRQLGKPVDVLRPPAGDVLAWAEGPVSWIRARASWVHPFRMVEFATSGEVEALVGPRIGDQGFYAWAWEDAGIGHLRARYFPTDLGIVEDEATGAAAVVMGHRFGRPLLIHQGVGSEILVRPGPGGTVEVGGRCALVGVRPFEL